MLNENKKYDYKRTIRISLFDPKSYQKVGATDPLTHEELNSFYLKVIGRLCTFI